MSSRRNDPSVSLRVGKSFAVGVRFARHHDIDRRRARTPSIGGSSGNVGNFAQRRSVNREGDWHSIVSFETRR
jgi:hypothetical protein